MSKLVCPKPTPRGDLCPLVVRVWLPVLFETVELKELSRWTVEEKEASLFMGCGTALKEVFLLTTLFLEEGSCKTTVLKVVFRRTRCTCEGRGCSQEPDRLELTMEARCTNLWPSFPKEFGNPARGTTPSGKFPDIAPPLIPC
jgi:hypothetical protein